MKKDVLRTIKNDMHEVHYCKKDVQHQIKVELAELEFCRKKALAENNDVADLEMRSWLNRQINESYRHNCSKIIMDLYDDWHNNQTYYLIYNDGSEVVISAEEILRGEPFPKMSDIVYAEMYSADEHIDTEVGNLDWYSDERMKACDWNYDDEDERKWQYETAIQFKFGTEWSARWHQNHPEFVPMSI